jgi:hypothetical protein
MPVEINARARGQWLTPIILATQEAEIWRDLSQHHQKGLVEWLKV